MIGKDGVSRADTDISVISAIPVFTKLWSEKQIENRKKFGKAARSAAALAKKPEIREKYVAKLKPRQNILNLVVSEKLKSIV